MRTAARRAPSELYLRDVDYGGDFRVGDAYAPDLDHLDVGYCVLWMPRAGEPLRVAVHTGCHAGPDDYVRSHFGGDDGVKRLAGGVVFDRETVDSFYAIDDTVRDQYRERISVDLEPISQTERAPAELTRD